MALTNLNREQLCQTATEQKYDLLIIGGGVTGASIALDASSRGMSTILIEKDDFATEASGQLTPLLSEQLYPSRKLWSKAYQEKTIIEQIASPLCWPIDVLESTNKMDPILTSNKTLAQQLIEPLKKSYKPNHYKAISKRSIRNLEPRLNERMIRSVNRYNESYLDQMRLTLSLLKKANQFGGQMINYMKAVRFLYDDQKIINGVEAEDQVTGELYQFKSRKVINATGSRLAKLSQLDSTDLQIKSSLKIKKMIQMRLARANFPLNRGVSFRNQVSGEMVHLVPINEWIYIMTYEPAEWHVIEDGTLSQEELIRLSNLLDQMFTDNDDLERNDLKSYQLTYVVDNDPFQLPNNGIVESTTGLITVIGAPLIFYRYQANRVVDLLMKSFKRQLNILYSKSETRSFRLIGEPADEALNALENHPFYCFTEAEKRYLLHHYGEHIDHVLFYLKQVIQEQAHGALNPLLFAELVYCLENEAIYKPIDFLKRRIKVFLRDQNNIQLQLHGILTYMENQLGWSQEERSYYERECRIWLNDCL
ncbi:FAD-dependent oxidoreductase [Amphibacillus sediminis]|uniref:FAD-dependent oxidoreductase n=1 Tax=Amphibacillus sediminis TaxID=360185 RepID=UPI00082A6497|nr:FAD-dependent oxidoreductase [Amphibacillus sediminis]